MHKVALSLEDLETRNGLFDYEIIAILKNMAKRIIELEKELNNGL